MRYMVSLILILIVLHLPVLSGGGEILDMTFTFDKNTVYWPTATPFNLKVISDSKVAGGWYYRSNNYCASEHGGTHVDAPCHFYKEGKSVDQIPLQQWIGPAVKIDVTKQCEKNRDYLLKVEDIKAWEKQNGAIPAGAWVIMYTGIDTKYYPDLKKVLGTDKKGPEAIPHLHFPGFSAESMKYLLKQGNISGIAIDTPSIDYGQSKDFIVHQILGAANKPAVENIAALDKLPANGAMLYVMPMKIKGGSGAPARVFAVLK